LNKIVYGPLEFNDKNIISGQCNTQHALNGESLAIDTLVFQAWTGQEPQGFILADYKKLKTADGLIFRVLTDNVNPSNLAIGTPLMYYFNDALIGKFYIDKINRNNNDTYTFNCISSVGMLERDKHYGGIYTGQTVKSVLQGLLSGIDYELDASLEDLKLYGYLPYDTKRNNLQQIQIATGLAVRTMPSGKLLITALSKDIKSNIDKTKAIVGGRFDREIPASKVVLTEHKYEESAKEDILFNDGLSGSTTIIFKEPYHSLSITGGTFTSSGANYATISGSGTVELKGKKYNHITQVVSKGISNDNVISIDKATLVTLVNSNDVLNRLYDVYTLTKVIEQDIIYNNERCGDLVNVINPYSLETENACVKSLDITMGGLLKAKGNFIVDFVPSQPTMGYSNRVVLTNGTSWVVPSGINKLRVILIGGGDGGSGGANGQNGGNGTHEDNGVGGQGGAGGLGGNGGNVLNTALTVTPGQSINYAVGKGGIGGIANALGNVGEHTTFSTLTTANGTNNNEYVDIYVGERYAIKGESSSKGGKGSGVDGLGETINGYVPGANGTFKSDANYIAGGGHGGGASNIANGFNGSDAISNNKGGKGGNGANGGNGTNATTYGSGGQGGYGGAGGGAGGGTSDKFGTLGAGGSGGSGGQGGKGADGCIIIYY